MTKKAQFIIPTILIKESNLIKEANLITATGQLLTRASKGPVTASIHRALQSGVNKGIPINSSTARTLFKDLRAAGTTRGSVSRNELAAKLRALRAGKTPPPLPKTPAATPPPLPKTPTTTALATPTTAAESAAYSPGLINRALSSTAGRVALPVATGAIGYGFGNSRGYDEGFGQGSLSAQQMAAIQAMQAQQQARQMYDNQGFLDRLTGRNPF